MEIYTSYYAKTKQLIENGIIPVSISLYQPRWFKGHKIVSLAPTKAMLDYNKEKYIEEYSKILALLDVNKLREDIKMISRISQYADVALLCYEKPGEFCHRRLFADWLKEKYGYEIKEFGITPQNNIRAVQTSMF